MTDYGVIKRKCQEAKINEMSVVLYPIDVLNILDELEMQKAISRALITPDNKTSSLQKLRETAVSFGDKKLLKILDEYEKT